MCQSERCCAQADTFATPRSRRYIIKGSNQGMCTNSTVPAMPSARARNKAAAAAVILLAAMLTACSEGETTLVGPDDSGQHGAAMNEIVTTPPLRATSNEDFSYFSFDEGKLVTAGDEWDLALRRYEVRLNSTSIAGANSRNVRGYAMNNNRDASNEQVLGFTAANQLAAFDAVREAAIPSDAAFTGDVLVEDPTAYLSFGAVPAANASAYWKIRLSDGSFAVFRVPQFVYSSGNGVTSVVFESRIQSAGGTLGSIRTLTASPGGEIQRINLVNNSVLGAGDASEPNFPEGACDWDLELDPAATELSITVNSSCGVATYPGPASPAFPAVAKADDAPQYEPFLSRLTGPIPSAIDDPGAPFRYNLDGGNRLHPVFNTYLILSAGRVYKLQVIDYYSDTGASGYPTLRYARIR